MAKWVSRTPPGFQFAVKLHQKFTHPDLYLARADSGEWTVTGGDVDEFRIGLEPVASAGRLAAVLLQFPAGFRADADARGYLEWLCEVFGAYPLAVELRHRSWSDDEVATRALLDAARAAWVYIDEPKFQSSIRQDLASASRSDLVYVRLHGRNAAEWWIHETADDRYNYLYSPLELRPIAAAARAAADSGRRVVMYLNNHFSAKAVANAAILKSELGQAVPGDYTRAMVERYPELAGVVSTSELPL
jgi:uncharacterized protein YecE (DUF72 family)